MSDPIVKKYNEHRIEMLRKQIETEKRDYEILVDGIRVLNRTNDADRFYDFETELESTVNELQFILYHGTSHRNQKYTFLMNSKEILPPHPVNGLGNSGDSEQVMNMKLNEKDKDYELARLREKLEETTKQLTLSEEQATTLESELTLLKEEKAAGKFNLAGLNIAELGGQLIRATIFSNASKNSTAAAVAGMLGALNPQPAADVPQEPVTESTFQDYEEHPQYTPDELQILQTIKKAQDTINTPQLKQVNTILSALITQPAQIIPVTEFLKIKN